MPPDKGEQVMNKDDIHTCHVDCQNLICVAVREAVAAEREACAKLCEMVEDDDLYFGSQYAAAIRARGQG
jgi:hypothetical protein